MGVVLRRCYLCGLSLIYTAVFPSGTVSSYTHLHLYCGDLQSLVQLSLNSHPLKHITLFLAYRCQVGPCLENSPWWHVLIL